MSSDPVPALTEAFLAAPFAEGGWLAALEQLAAATGSSRAQIIGIGDGQVVHFNHIANLDSPRLLAGFAAIGGGSPLVNWRIAAQRGPFELVDETQYGEVQLAGKFDAYNDLAASLGLQHGCQTILRSGASGLLGYALLRSTVDGKTTEHAKTLFMRTAPVVLRAIDLQIALDHQGAALIARSMEGMRATAFVLSGQGSVLALTPAADAEARRAGLLSLRGGKLCAADRRHQAHFARLLAMLCGGKTGQGRLWLPDVASEGEGATCDLFALPGNGLDFGCAARILVTLRRPQSTDGSTAQLLTSAWDLTVGEAEIAVLIGDGMSRREIARHRNVSEQTVNAQLKSIFAKAGVGREAALAARVRAIGA